MKDEISRAIEDIKNEFPQNEVMVTDDGNGGAHVIVERVCPGDPYTQMETWIGFRITFQYPYADVYPHFVRSDLSRKDGRPLGDGMSGGHTFLGRPAIQISRRSNRLNPSMDTAVLKLIKVLAWMRTRQ
jgi:hypothetical protein